MPRLRLAGDPHPARGRDRVARPGGPASRGRPFDADSQAQTLELALRVLESAPAARTTVQSPLRWRDDASWKRDFSDLSRLTPEEIAERRKEFDVVKAVIKDKPGRT